jgi:hypothetical protein
MSKLYYTDPPRIKKEKKMTKLYYSDPLISAYMAREFGVLINIDTSNRYFTHNESTFLEYGFKEDDSKVNTWIQYSTCYKFYIHPDSYDIFEPRGDDKVINGAGGMFEVNGEGVVYGALGIYDGGDIDIIIRDGKPFFTPEVSDD